jgi:hypothetical protein
MAKRLPRNFTEIRREAFVALLLTLIITVVIVVAL